MNLWQAGVTTNKKRPVTFDEVREAIRALKLDDGEVEEVDTDLYLIPLHPNVELELENQGHVEFSVRVGTTRIDFELEMP